MSAAASTISLVWASVYFGLGGFFLVASRHLKGRGYELLAAALGFVALSGVGEWLFFRSGPSPIAFVAARLIVLCAALAPALHTHFVFRYCGRSDVGRVAFTGYVLSGAGVVADWASAAGFFARLGSLDYPVGYVAPIDTVGFFVASAFCGHLLVDAVALGLAVRRGRPNTRWPFWIILLLGPAVAYDVVQVLTSGRNFFFTEATTWVYGLVIVGGLLNELRGAEGLLRKTTSSLAERTAELEISYAEMELMHSELTRKQQLAAVGELAAAIAHEVRNPLAIIMNAASGLKRERISEDDKATLLGIVDEESERLNQLVSELLRFARPVNASRAPASLLDICNRVAARVPDGYRVEVESEGKPLSAVWVDSGLFTLALESLLSNATDAMPEGGTLRMVLGRSRFDDGAPAAEVRLIDNGHGMPRDVLERSKKPFFTTRPRGTGLGLPIVERIAEAHGGELIVESEVDRGTTVILKVPFEDDPSTRYPGSKSPTGRRRMRSVPPSSNHSGPLESEATHPTSSASSLSQPASPKPN